MYNIQDLITKRKQAAKKLEPKRRTSKGVTIGKDYDDSPQVEDRPGFVWVREDKQGGGVFECFNPSVKLAVDIPVIIARESGKSSRRVIQSVDWDALLVAITSSPPGIALSVPNHHRDHEFITMFPGLDVVNIYPRAMVPLKIYPGSTALTISVAPGYYMVDKTTTYYVGSIDADISSYVPSTAGNTVSLLVFIDSATNLVGYLAGTEGTLLFPVEPAIPDGYIGLGYIRLTNGYAGLVTETMITNDPRPFISIATGSGSGSGTPATTVTDETTWGITPAVGTSTNYARQDHTHGSPEAPTGTGHTVQDEGSDLPARTHLNFTGAGVSASDDAGNDATVISVGGGSGSCGTDFDVSAVVSGMVSYHKASVGVSYSSDFVVSQVNDQENNYDATPPGNGPLYIGDTPVGWPGLYFDGIDQYLVSAAFPASGAGARTLYAVISSPFLPDNGYHHILHYGDSDTDKAYGIILNVNTYDRKMGNHYWGDSMIAVSPPLMQPSILMMIYDGADDHMYWGTSLVGLKTITLDTGSVWGLQIGSRISGPGELGCFIAHEWGCWNSALSDANRLAIVAGLKSKYCMS